MFFSSINSTQNLVDLFSLLYGFMIEVLVCFMYNILLYHFVYFFCIIVMKLSLEAACNRNRNIEIEIKFDLKRSSPLFKDLDKFHQPTPAVTPTIIQWAGKIQMEWGRGGGSMRTYFFRKKPFEFFFYPWKFQTEQSFPQEIPQNCVAPLLEIPCHGQKPTPMGVQHNFFLITPANFFSFVIKPQNFHMLFPQYLWKSHVFNPPYLVFLE